MLVQPATGSPLQLRAQLCMRGPDKATRKQGREGGREEGTSVPEYTVILLMLMLLSLLKFNEKLEHTFYLLRSLNSNGVENEPKSSGNDERSLVKAEDFIEIWKTMLDKYCRLF